MLEIVDINPLVLAVFAISGYLFFNTYLPGPARALLNVASPYDVNNSCFGDIIIYSSLLQNVLRKHGICIYMADKILAGTVSITPRDVSVIIYLLRLRGNALPIN